MKLAGWLGWLLIGAGLLAIAPATALDPDRTLQQYKHTRWATEDGAPGVILALAQGNDGYLWIGSRDGLFRFDGLRFERIASDRDADQRSVVSTILPARDGTLWVGYSSGGVETYRRGVLRDAGLPNSSAYVMSLVEARDGAIWALLGGVYPQLARHQDGRWVEVGENWGLPPEAPIDVHVARDGTLWLTTLQSVYFLRPGSRRFQRVDAAPTGHAALSEDAMGRIWIVDDAGARPLAPGSRAIPYPTPVAPRSVGAFFDRDGNLWGLTGLTGIFRVRAPDPAGGASAAGAAAQVDRYTNQDGLTSDNAYALFEDREGNIWVGTSTGLDRFRAANVVVEPRLTRLPTWGEVLLGASDGSVYVGEADAFYRIRPRGRPEPILAADDAEAMCEAPDGAIWMITSRQLFRFRDGRFTSVPRPSTRSVHDCAVDRHGTLWVTTSEGLFRLAGQAWQLHALPGIGEETSDAPLMRGGDGRLVVYSGPRSLDVIDFPRRGHLVLGRPDALRDLRTIHQARQGLLVGGRFGLARLRGRRAHFIAPGRVRAFTGITGIVQTPEGETWTIGSRGISRMSTAELEQAFDDPQRRLEPQLFDIRDGLPAFNVRDGKRDAVRGGDGRLWFATTAGTVWVDPGRLARNLLPPPVAISALRANGVSYRDPTAVTLPRGTSHAELDFAALSLSVPERVQVRYRLEGADADWVDPGQRRQAFYANLGPGTYRFRVIAANNDGVWNNEGATVEFTIPPTFLQSNFFRLLCIAAVILLLWLAYSIRVRHLTARARAGLEVRLAERERIARELHDTLLQSFQGLVLRFQAVANQIPEDQPLRPVIDRALERADKALIEGRDRVQELRPSGEDPAQSMIDLAEALAAESDVRFNLTVEGQPRELHPMVRDELRQIGAEAIRNAFQHAQANEIEALLTYGSRELRFELRDDGIGMPRDLASGGTRHGHFGLIGMRERANRIGGTFTITSRAQGGTQVHLSIPDRAAYAVAEKRWWTWLPASWRKS